MMTTRREVQVVLNNDDGIGVGDVEDMVIVRGKRRG